MKARTLLVVCLSLRAALDLHCRIECRDDGEIGGRWNEKAKVCECSYLRLPKTPVETPWVTPAPIPD